ncbi:hypothetical protein [Faecalibacterium prausnitzii]|jgi:hypothetical protein|uniref:hypothetical protein n=1 Tax=Faecalibacterium prausnitzii TaxID=853 RepID=UPI0029661E7C|nr:hypothetical protein [Faecalibacterium prausnitzii]MDW2997341.1 hypothetical protein [Faecalibacterium prausnitzii]
MQTKKKAAIHERKILMDRQIFSLKLLYLRCGQNLIIDQLIGLVKDFDHLVGFSDGDRLHPAFWIWACARQHVSGYLCTKRKQKNNSQQT